MEYIDTVAKNLSDLPKFSESSSLRCVRELMSQIRKAKMELKFLKTFVCFISDRCIASEPTSTQQWLPGYIFQAMKTDIQTLL